MADRSLKSGLQRISITIPGQVLGSLDKMVEERGYANRSQGINEILNREIAKFQSDQSDQVMAGSITVVYENTKENVQGKLAAIQRDHIDEVISSLHVHLEENHTMEVLLVQGKAGKLREITNELISIKGVKNGTLTLTTTIMPPIQSKN